jgi:hypothetical protein
LLTVVDGGLGSRRAGGLAAKGRKEGAKKAECGCLQWFSGSSELGWPKEGKKVEKWDGSWRLFAIACSGLRWLMGEGELMVFFNKGVDFGWGDLMVLWIPVHVITPYFFRLWISLLFQMFARVGSRW